MPYTIFAKFKGEKKYTRWYNRTYKNKEAVERAAERLRKRFKNKYGWAPIFKVRYVKR